jgi:hypothetical protein
LQDYRYSLDGGTSWSDWISWNPAGTNTFTITTPGDYTNLVVAQTRDSLEQISSNSSAVTVKIRQASSGGSGSPTVIIDGKPSGSSDFDSLQKAANFGQGYTQQLQDGTLHLDAEAIKSILGQTQDKNLSIAISKMPEVSRSDLNQTQAGTLAVGDIVYEITLVSDGVEIHEFEGTIEVSVPYTGKLPVKAWFLGEQGKSDKIDGIYNAEDGTFTFKVPHLSLYVVGPDDETDMEYMVRTGLMTGFSDGSLRPENPVTRGQLVTILYRLSGKPTGYENAIDWALQTGIVTGYSDGSFRPGLAITRQQFAAILYRYAKGETTSIQLPFGDSSQVSNYAKNAVAWCYENGIINGKSDGSFDPFGVATRAQTAAMIRRFAEN